MERTTEEHDHHDEDQTVDNNPLRHLAEARGSTTWLEHALGRGWNANDTKRVLRRMQDEITEEGGVSFVQSLTRTQREAILHRVIRKDIEDLMAADEFGGEWDESNVHLLFGDVLEQVGEMWKSILLGYLQVRVCRGDEAALGKEEMCVVCQNELWLENERTGKLECGHEFHAECITPWLRRNVVCPLC